MIFIFYFKFSGQEEGTVDFEGETKIMPFNMKEEMEEGHFDGDGFYHFKKNTEQIKDAWLDDIDWVKVCTSIEYEIVPKVRQRLSCNFVD